MLSHDGVFPVRIADVPSCRPRMVADSGEILAYDSGLYQDLGCVFSLAIGLRSRGRGRKMLIITGLWVDSKRSEISISCPVV